MMNKKNIITFATLFLITLIYFFANMQKVLVPGATFNEIQQIFDLDAAAVTRSGAIFLYVYAAVQLVTGLLADRYSGMRVVVFGGVIFCAGSLMSACTISFPLLCVSRFLTGLGAATIYLSMVKEIARVAGSYLPFFLGIATIIGYSGAITGASPFIAGVEHFGYTRMMLAAGIMTLLIYCGFLFAVKKNGMPPVCNDVKFNLASYKAVFARKHNMVLMFSIGINFGTFFALQSIIGKKFLEDYCHISNHSAGAVMTVTMVIAAVNGFILANVSKLLGNRRRPILHFSSFGCLCGAAMIFFAVLNDCRLPVIPVSGLILLAIAGNVSPISVALTRETNEEQRFGTVMSVNNGFAYAVTAIFGGALGKLMDLYPPTLVDGINVYGKNSYLLVFGVLLILCVISSVVSLFLKESYGKNIAASVR